MSNCLREQLERGRPRLVGLRISFCFWWSLCEILVCGIACVCVASCRVQPAGAEPSAVPASGEHHGGILVPLTDKEAYVELVNGERKKNGSSFDTTLIAFVLRPDQKTALVETPTSVQAKVQTPKGEQEVTFKSRPIPPIRSGAVDFSRVWVRSTCIRLPAN